MKPIIHFAHANGVPSQVYTELFKHLQDEFEILYVPMIGTDPRYPVKDHWDTLVNQVIDSIVLQANGRSVIGLGHSFGAVLNLMAQRKRPDLFNQLVMLDPPLILGKASLVFHVLKHISPKHADKITPASLSARRRDHWPSREDAAQSLGNKGFYKGFHPTCFKDYIAYALQDDPNGGVSLSIPKQVEVDIFRTTPSWWWLPFQQKPTVPTHILVGQQSDFLKHKFPQIAEKKLGIEFSTLAGGHMFPLEHPLETAAQIRKIIYQQQSLGQLDQSKA